MFFQGMAADKKSQNFFFRCQARLLVPIRNVRQLVIVRLGVFLLENSEQAVLTGFHVALGFLGTIHGAVENSH